MNNDNLFYKFDFSTCAIEDFLPFFSALFRDSEFQKQIEKRNHLAKSIIDQGGRNKAIIKTLDVLEERIGRGMLQGMFEFSKHLKGHECMMAADLMKDPSMTPEQRALIQKAMVRIDALTFLNDIMLGQLNDAISELKKVDEAFSIPELDGMKHSLKTMYDWGRKRREGDTEAEAELFNEYADSIEQYLKGRINTFLEKYKKLKNNKNDLQNQKKTGV